MQSQQEQPEQSTTTVYYEPANCSRIDCPVCLTESKEAVMALIPVAADGSIIRSNNDNILPKILVPTAVRIIQS